jgi:predicted amidophosphoribosyltransferase
MTVSNKRICPYCHSTNIDSELRCRHCGRQWKRSDFKVCEDNGVPVPLRFFGGTLDSRPEPGNRYLSDNQ